MIFDFLKNALHKRVLTYELSLLCDSLIVHRSDIFFKNTLTLKFCYILYILTLAKLPLKILLFFPKTVVFCRFYSVCGKSIFSDIVSD